MSRPSVFRAVGRLHDLGLINRTSYGGRHHRNRYEPNWESLNRTSGDTVQPKSQQLISCTVNSLTSCTQTYLRERRRRCPELRGRPRPSVARGKRDRASRGQRYLIHGLTGGKAASARDAAEAGEQRHLAKANGQLQDPRDRNAPWLAAIDQAETKPDDNPPNGPINTPTRRG